MPAFALGLLAATFATMSWGIQLPLAKDAFAVVDPFVITSFRYAVAALCLIPILLWREGWASMSYRGHGFAASGLGLIGICGSPSLVFLGMSMSEAEHAVVIVSLQPVITALAFWILRGQRPKAMTLLCMGVAFAGVVLVVTRGQLEILQTPEQMLGDGIVFLGSVCWVIYTMGLARLNGWSTWRITVLTMVPGAIASCLLAGGLIAIGAVVAPTVEALTEVGWDLAYLSFVGVLLAMLAWNFGTRRVGAMNSMLLINVMPVTTFAYRAAQGKQFELIEIGGALMVVSALIVNNLYLRALYRQTKAAQP